MKFILPYSVFCLVTIHLTLVVSYEADDFLPKLDLYELQTQDVPTLTTETPAKLDTELNNENATQKESGLADLSNNKDDDDVNTTTTQNNFQQSTVFDSSSSSEEMPVSPKGVENDVEFTNVLLNKDATSGGFIQIESTTSAVNKVDENRREIFMGRNSPYHNQEKPTIDQELREPDHGYLLDQQLQHGYQQLEQQQPEQNYEQDVSKWREKTDENQSPNMNEYSQLLHRSQEETTDDYWDADYDAREWYNGQDDDIVLEDDEGLYDTDSDYDYKLSKDVSKEEVQPNQQETPSDEIFEFFDFLNSEDSTDWTSLEDNSNFSNTYEENDSENEHAERLEDTGLDSSYLTGEDEDVVKIQQPYESNVNEGNEKIVSLDENVDVGLEDSDENPRIWMVRLLENYEKNKKYEAGIEDTEREESIVPGDHNDQREEVGRTSKLSVYESDLGTDNTKGDHKKKPSNANVNNDRFPEDSGKEAADNDLYKYKDLLAQLVGDFNADNSYEEREDELKPAASFEKNTEETIIISDDSRNQNEDFFETTTVDAVVSSDEKIKYTNINDTEVTHDLKETVYSNETDDLASSDTDFARPSSDSGAIDNLEEGNSFKTGDDEQMENTFGTSQPDTRDQQRRKWKLPIGGFLNDGNVDEDKSYAEKYLDSEEDYEDDKAKKVYHEMEEEEDDDEEEEEEPDRPEVNDLGNEEDTAWEYEEDDETDDFDETKNHPTEEDVEDDEEIARRTKRPTAPTSMVLFYTWLIVAVLIVIMAISSFQSRCKGMRFPWIKAGPGQREDRKRLMEHQSV